MTLHGASAPPAHTEPPREPRSSGSGRGSTRGHSPGRLLLEAAARARPREGLALAPLKEAAWETARSTGALRLLDYRIASQLSETYVIQRGTMMQTQRLISERFLTPPDFDPAQQRTMLMTSYMLMVELSGQESYLIEVYQSTLRQLEEAERSSGR